MNFIKGGVHFIEQKPMGGFGTIAMASTNTWVRKALDVSKLPRIKLNCLRDLPGAKSTVSNTIHKSYLFIFLNFRYSFKELVEDQDQAVVKHVVEVIKAK